MTELAHKNMCGQTESNWQVLDKVREKFKALSQGSINNLKMERVWYKRTLTWRSTSVGWVCSRALTVSLQLYKSVL